MPDRIQIAVVTDEAYTVPLYVMMCSLLENKEENRGIDIFILHKQLSPLAKGYFQELAENEPHIQFHFVVIPKEWLENIPPNHFEYISEATFYRFALPDLLPAHVSKVIYLDGDLLVEEDISALWEMDLAGKALGAIAEYFPGIPASDFQKNLYKKLGLAWGRSYFNAGVLVLDLKQWRERKWAKACMDFLLNYPERITFDDQDALNYVLRDDWKALPAKWNITHIWFRFEKELRKKKLFEPAEKPAIIHFTTQNKPWQAKSEHPYQKRFSHYWENSSLCKQAHLTNETKSGISLLCILQEVEGLAKALAYWTRLTSIDEIVLLSVGDDFDKIQATLADFTSNKVKVLAFHQVEKHSKALFLPLAVSKCKYDKVLQIDATFTPFEDFFDRHPLTDSSLYTQAVWRDWFENKYYKHVCIFAYKYSFMQLPLPMKNKKEIAHDSLMCINKKLLQLEQAASIEVEGGAKMELLQKELREVYASFSWKITRPLRRIAALFVKK